MIIRKQSGWNSGSADNDGRALRLSIVRGYALFFFIRRVVRRYVGYRQLTAECRVERYNAFAPCKTKGLELVVDDVEQMMIVQSVYFDEHGMRRTGNERDRHTCDGDRCRDCGNAPDVYKRQQYTTTFWLKAADMFIITAILLIAIAIITVITQRIRYNKGK